MQKSILFTSLVLITIEASASPIAIPNHISSTCTDMASVAYWGATEHLSKVDKKNADAAAKSALIANRQRPAIEATRVEKARSMGAMSHGNAGKGLTNIDAARQDGILTAIHVYESCLTGDI